MTRPAASSPTQLKGRSLRMLNLAIALINAQRPWGKREILARVEGYDPTADTSATAAGVGMKTLERDLAALSALGMPILIQEDAEDTPGSGTTISLDRAALFLPPGDFGEEHAVAWSNAVQWLDTVAPAGLAPTAAPIRLKLAAAGFLPDAEAQEFIGSTEFIELTTADARHMTVAIARHLRISFDYYPSLLDPPTTRTLEPWAYAAVDGVFYLTGFDVDRGAQRTFRLRRLGTIRALPQIATQPRPQASPEQLVRSGLASVGQELVSARLAWSNAAAAGPLRKECDAEQRISSIDRERLISTVAAHAPELRIVEPPELHAAVVDRLTQARDCMSSEPAGVFEDPTPTPTSAEADSATSSTDTPADSPTSSDSHAPQTRGRGVDPVAVAWALLAWCSRNPGASPMRAASALRLSVVEVNTLLTTLHSHVGRPDYFPDDFVDISLTPHSIVLSNNLGVTDPLRFTRDECSALSFALVALRASMPAEALPAINDLQAYVDRFSTRPAPPLADAGSVPPLPPAHPTDHASPLRADILDAMRRRRRVTLRYYSQHRGQEGERVVDIDHFAAMEGALYIWVREVTASGEVDTRHKTFLLDNIRALSCGDPGSASARVEPHIDHEDPFGFRDSARVARLHLAPQCAWMIEHYAMDLVGELEDGRWEVTLPDGGPWPEGFVIAHTPQVTVVAEEEPSPASTRDSHVNSEERVALAERVRRRCDRALDAYAQGYPLSSSTP